MAGRGRAWVFTTTGPARATVDGGGSGLGLTIALASAGAMGAEIRVDSRPGEGSTFSLVLRGTS